MKFEEFRLLSRVRGTKVHYTDPNTGKIENGIVQTYVPVMKPDGFVDPEKTTEVFVVYKSGGDWSKYENYTAVRTSLEHLELGWKKKFNFKT